MKRLSFAVLIGMLAFAARAGAAQQRQIIGTTQDHSLAEANDCEHFYKRTFTTFRSQVHQQEQREFIAAPERQLQVTASHEGGVSIRGWNRRYTRLVTCRWAAADSRLLATQVLDSVKVTAEGSEITTQGPAVDDTQTWWVNMIIYVPRNASVDVRSASGGIAIRNMTGRVTASATSGGISLAHSSGQYKISTVSGGITLERVNGIVEAISQEGTIALKVPKEHVPAFEARTAMEGQILCTLANCRGEDGWASGGKLLRFGHGVPGIKISTSAPIIIGPVTD